jgi:hypothetical protein
MDILVSFPMHWLLVMLIIVTLEFKMDVKDITAAIQSFYQMGTAGPLWPRCVRGTVCCMFILCFVLSVFVMPLEVNASLRFAPGQER